jgi:8-oxo-dGTP pyrophosphatase MutT (NUDIX family)
VTFLEQALHLIREFQEPEDEKSRELILGLLAHSPDPLSRHQFTPGHLTCTGLLIHPDRSHILLIHHRRLNRWLLPGGHVEAADPSPAEAARREAQEETAVLTLPFFALAGMDVHGIPGRGAEPYHLHYDLKFAFLAQSGDFAADEAETRAAAWCPLTDLAFHEFELPASIRRAARRGRLLLEDLR